MAPSRKSFYEILGVSPDASPEDIARAYQARSAELRDAVPPDPGGEALAHEAYEVLSNPQRRSAYDASLAGAAAQPQAITGEVVPPATVAAAPRRMHPIFIVVSLLILLPILFLMLRDDEQESPPPPAPAAEAPQATAPQPPPAPPAPRVRVGSEILAEASISAGQLLAIDMAGVSTPVGMAILVAPRAMITTCHNLPVGSKLVVRAGSSHHPAELTVADEQLDLCRLSVPDFTAEPFERAPGMPAVGDPIFVVGMSATGTMAATEGTIRALRSTVNGEVLEISVPVAASASGGGVFDHQGRLLGIATTTHKLGPDVHIAMPASWIPDMQSRSRAP